MNNINYYYLLFIVPVVVVIIYLYRRKSNFQAVPEQTEQLIKENNTWDPLHNESRYRYPYSPPVHPQMEELTITDILPKSYPPEVAEGLSSELINIPLQYNDPTREQLRSQPILITPYNRIKYSGQCYN